ncbi:MAG TPA: hypothetical protein DEF42_07830 [Desulfosporosinus sp.]|nr:hypothetical protein [Desulfosporosinus sp.]
MLLMERGCFKSKFEFDGESDAQLNKLGNEGWELVTMVSPIFVMKGSTVNLIAPLSVKCMP